MRSLPPFAAGAALRAANLLLFVAWLWSLTRRGLLASMSAPCAAVAAYAAANGALAARPGEPPKPVEAGLIAADVALVGWAAAWASAGEPDAHLALLVPVFMAAVRLRAPWALGVAGLAAGVLLTLIPAAARADSAYRCIFLLAAPWGLALFARAALRSRAAAVRERTALARSLFFHEFLTLFLFQVRDYLTSVTSVGQHLSQTAPEGPVKELAGKLAKMISELNLKLRRMNETVEEHTTTRRPARGLEWSLEPLLRECLESAAASYAVPSLSTRLWVDPRIGAIKGDREAAAAAFTAVFENSLEAFLAAGRGGRITVSAMLDGDKAVAELMDDAGGVSPEAEANLFKPLFTTKSARGGIGLGLAMARRLLERGGGTMSVRSEAGRTFARVELPLKPGLPVVRNEESTWAGRRSSLS